MDSLLEFYKILYNIALSWPYSLHTSGAQEHYKRLNTFAVVDHPNQILSGNLGKDKRYIDKELFFNRYHDESGQLNRGEIMYPALLIWEQPYNVKDLMSKHGGKDEVSIRAGLFNPYFDKLSPGAPDYTYGKQRTAEEIKEGLRFMRKQLFSELDKWVKAETFLASVSQGEGWYNRSYLDTLNGAGVVMDQYKITAALSNLINGDASRAATIVDVDAQGLVEHYINFTVKLDSCPSMTVYPAPVNVAKCTEPEEVVPESLVFAYNANGSIKTVTSASKTKSISYKTNGTINTVSDGTYLKTFSYNVDGSIDEIIVSNI